MKILFVGSTTASVPMFPADAVIRRVSLEPALFLAAGRALLLQLAWPAVASGVADHSEFKRNPFKRLQGTLEAVTAMVFGSRELADRVGARVRDIHSFITGPGYSANDPTNLLWVHATLVDSALWAYETFVEPLSPEDAETYYAEMKVVAAQFGVPDDAQPATLAAFRAYVAEAFATLQPTDVSRDLSQFIVDPSLPFALHVPFLPLLRVQRLLTLGSLPSRVRDELGFPWSTRDERRYQRVVRLVRASFRATPRAVRVAPVRLNATQLLYFADRHSRAA